MALTLSAGNPGDVRFNRDTKTIILVEIADESFYFASQAIANADFTGTGNDYLDEIDASGGLGVIERSVPSEGGFGSVGNVTMNLLNQGDPDATPTAPSDILNSKPFLENDEVKIYVVFDDETTLNYAEKVILMTGYIDDFSIDENAFRIDIVDASKRFNRLLPMYTINESDFPNADPGSIGNAIQMVYGDFIGTDINGWISLPFQKQSFSCFKSCGVVDEELQKHIFGDHAFHTLPEGILTFEAGTDEPSEDDILGGDDSGNAGDVIEIDLQTGTWGGNNAAGVILIDGMTGQLAGDEDVDNDTTADPNVVHTRTKSIGAIMVYIDGLNVFAGLYSAGSSFIISNGSDTNNTTTIQLPSNTLCDVYAIPELRHIDDPNNINDTEIKTITDDDLTNKITLSANEKFYVKLSQASIPGEPSQGESVAAFLPFPGTIVGTIDVKYIDNPGTAAAAFDKGLGNVNAFASNLAAGDSDSNITRYFFNSPGKTWDKWLRFGIGLEAGAGESIEIRYMLILIAGILLFDRTPRRIPSYPRERDRHRT